MITFDEFVDTRVGIGKAQYFIIIILFLVDINDGAQTVLNSFLNPIAKNQWSLNSFQVQILSSIFYLGILFGSLISGKLADTYGRRPIILIGSLFHLLVCAIFLLVNNYKFMVVVRFLYGITHGLTIVLTTCMFSEIVTTKWRGKGLLILNFFASVGKIFSVGLAYYFLDDFTSGDWKMLMFTSSFSCLLVLVLGYFKLRESARFQLANGDDELCFITLNWMIYQNNKNFIQITQEEKQSLLIWRQKHFRNIQKGQYKSLFSKQYRITTISLATAWFFCNFMYHGQLIVLPFIFGKQHLNFNEYALTLIGEAPTLIVTLFMIDNPNFGRKKSLSIFFILSGLFHLIFCFKPITLFTSITRFFMKLCFQILYPFTTQSFGTLNRTIGVGFCGASGRFGAFLMPYVIIPLLEIGKVEVFITFVLVSILGLISSIMVPRDTLGIGLDEANQGKMNNDRELKQLLVSK